jgi:protein-L-isoaspartate O-methyltransferase
MKLTNFNFIKLFLISFLIINTLSRKKTKWLKKICINDSAYNLVKRLIDENYIKHTCVARVMCELDRSLFTDSKEMAYDWDPTYIGYGATISGPRVHANALEKALEKFDRNQRIKILDLGSGSGYL